MDNKLTRNLLWFLFTLLTLPVAYGILWGGCFYFGNNPPLRIDLPLIAYEAYKHKWPWPDWLLVTCGLSFLSCVLIVCLNPFTEAKTTYGNAQWARVKDIVKMGLKDKSGLIVGMFSIFFLRFDKSLSVLLVAPPGSGKTQGIIVPNLLSCANSVLVHDPKKELYYKTGPRRAEFSKVIMFAPAEEGSACWNPLSKSELPEDWADVQILVTRLAATHFPMPEKGDSVWADNARSLFTFWALYQIHKNGETSLPEVLEVAIDGPPQELIMEALGITFDDETGEPSEPDETLPKRIRLEGRSLATVPERQFGGYFGNFKSGMSIYLDERIAKNLSTSDFSLKDLRKERTSLYVCVKNSDQTRIRMILNNFFESSILCFLDEEPKKEEMSITYMMDEMMRLGNLTEMLNAPAISRSYRVNSLFVWQSFEQITHLYGSTGIGLFKGCCAYHIYFAPNEGKVAEELSRDIGPKTQKKTSTSNNFKSLWSASSESVSWEGVPLVRPQEIMSMDADHVIIMAQNNYNRPIKARVPYWYKDRTMKAMIPTEEDQGPLFEMDVERSEENQDSAAEEKPEFSSEIKRVLSSSDEKNTIEESQGLVDRGATHGTVKSEDLPPEDENSIEDELKNDDTEVQSDEQSPAQEPVPVIDEEPTPEPEEEEIFSWGDKDEEDVSLPGVCDECGNPCESENDLGNSCEDEDCSGTYVSIQEED